MGIYDKNIKALRKYHPEVVELIESVILDKKRIEILQTKSGDPRIRYIKENGEEIYIHNTEDPSNCAKQAIDLLGQMEKEGIAVIFGFGLGYFAEAVFKRFEKGHVILIYESTPELFKIALETRDHSELLESNKVKIFLGDEIEDFSILHNYKNHIANGKFWIVKHHPSIKLNEKAYDKFYKKLNEEKRLSDSGTITAINLGKDFMNSFMANIPSLIRNPGVKKLKDIFKGMPAIIVSAGPSLEKNVHLLKKAKGKSIIIAVDVALPTLLPAGIVPDVLVAIDPLPSNITVFKDNIYLKDIPFICYAQYTPEIVNLYPGPVFINNDPRNIISQWLGSLWGDKGYIECFGGSVSHLAFGAAEYMGADVIAFIGQDLSYEEKFHAGNVTKLLHAFVNEELPDYKKGAHKVVDIFGEQRHSSGSLLSFKTSFEKKIKNFAGTVINATEGGLPIEGTVSMRFIDFINQYCRMPEIDTFSILSETTVSDISCDLNMLINEIVKARDKLREIRNLSNRILKHIKRLNTLKEKGQKDTEDFHTILSKVESLIDRVKHPMLNLLVDYHYGLELYLIRHDIQEIDEIEDKWEKLDKQLERGVNYYSELIKATDLFNKQLDKLVSALQREKQVNSILSDESLEQNEKFWKVGIIYKKAGIINQAVKYLEAVKDDAKEISNALHIRDMYISLVEMYFKQFRYDDAKKLLEKIRDKESKNKQQKISLAEYLKKQLKSCDERILALDRQEKDWGKKLEKVKGVYGSHLESGFFYFRIKNFEMAEKHYQQAIVECESSDQTNTDSKSLIEAYYGLAHTYLAQNNPEQAVEALERAIVVEPDNPVFYRDLGLIAIENNNIEPAEIFLSKAIELAPEEPELYKPLVNLYLSIGNKDKAVALYENAISSNSSNPSMQHELALIYKETITEAKE